MANQRRNSRSKGNVFDQNVEAFKTLTEKMSGKKIVQSQSTGNTEKNTGADQTPKKKTVVGAQKNSNPVRLSRSHSDGKKQPQKPIAEEILEHFEKLINSQEKKSSVKPVEAENKTPLTSKSSGSQKPTGYYGKVSSGTSQAIQDAPSTPSKKVGKFKSNSNNGKKTSANSNRKTAYIVVGIDFGTSCTKVVFREPYMGRAWAVPFHPELESVSVYLQQTVVYVAKNGRVFLDKADGYHKCADLKMLFLTDENRMLFKDEEGGVKGRLKDLSACYIALVLKKARQWFEAEHGYLFAGSDIVWQLNVGMPAENYDDDMLHKRFLHLAQIGWYLAQLTVDITLYRANKAWDKVKLAKFEPKGIQKELINVVPEVAAEVAGYARSSQREEGLHLLVDVGAGTMDISTFLLNGDEGDDRYDFMAADVSPRGCFMLHKSRVKEVVHSFEQLMHQQEEMEDLSSPVPDTIEELLPVTRDIMQSLQDGYDNGDQVYANECVGAVATIVNHTKLRRCPDSSAWRGELPVFLCGGGSQLPFYQNMIIKTRERLRRHIRGWQGFRLVDLPWPERFEANQLGPQHYHRIAVANGLSYPYDEIGKIVPPSKIDDVEQEDISRERVAAPTSKDMV